jgi:hypothetical protein
VCVCARERVRVRGREGKKRERKRSRSFCREESAREGEVVKERIGFDVSTLECSVFIWNAVLDGRGE